jgi:hypothetical protein
MTDSRAAPRPGSKLWGRGAICLYPSRVVSVRQSLVNRTEDLTSLRGSPYWRSMTVITITPQQLRKAADLKERIDVLQSQLNELLDGGTAIPAASTDAPSAKASGGRRRRLSARGRANISAAAKARWAARRLMKTGSEAPAAPAQAEAPVKRPRSAAWRKALAAAMKARWARAKRAGKSRL